MPNNIDDNTLSGEQKIQSLDLLNAYSHVFSTSDSDLDCTNLIEHEIYVGDTPPVRSRPYRTDLKTRETLWSHIQDMFDAYVIQPSASPYGHLQSC